MGNTTEHKIFLEDNESIRNFMQLVYITLSSTGETSLRRLEDAYRAMQPSIHSQVNSSALDVACLIYSLQRMPECIQQVQSIFLAQSDAILRENGVDTSGWQEVYASARRRRYLFDGEHTLVCFIASKSDVDDILPTLIAIQIEWNKLHSLLETATAYTCVSYTEAEREQITQELARLAGIDVTDAQRLLHHWAEQGPAWLAAIKNVNKDFSLQNFEASYCRYRRETETWWREIARACPYIEERPVFFVSSNGHSLINLLSGYAQKNHAQLVEFAAQSKDATLEQWAAQQGEQATPSDNFLYHVLKKFENADKSGKRRRARFDYESSIGITHIASRKTLDVPAQVLDISALIDAGCLSKELVKNSSLLDSHAMILNIDYPLGRAAYFILNKLAEHIPEIRGIYIIGKAASLFADRGDILIPSVVIDQHTRNEIFFENCFTVADIKNNIHSKKHAIFDNQKAVTVLGTFLQNKSMLGNFLAQGVTDLEMETGPYLSAIYEIGRSKRYPENENISLKLPEIEVGVVHYVSDNPLSEHKLDASLALDGLEATYAVTRAAIEKIFNWENRHRS